MPTPTTQTDFKREFAELYSAGVEPSLIDVPELAYLMVDGHGDPNTSAQYQAAVEALYTVSYTVKFAIKRANGIDFPVMPLEGLWWVADMARFKTAPKSDWSWTAMIMQPEPVTAETVELAREQAASKQPLPSLELMRFERFREGRAAQVLHRGPYAEEGPTIARLHAFIDAEGCTLNGRHHEIYLGDPRRSAPERLRTIIRQPIACS